MLQPREEDMKKNNVQQEEAEDGDGEKTKTHELMASLKKLIPPSPPAQGRRQLLQDFDRFIQQHSRFQTSPNQQQQQQTSKQQQQQQQQQQQRQQQQAVLNSSILALIHRSHQLITHSQLHRHLSHPIIRSQLDHLASSFHNPSEPFPISSDFLSKFQSAHHLIASLKLIISSLSLAQLVSIDHQLSIDQPYSSGPPLDQPPSQQSIIPTFGSNDLKLVQSLAQSISNYSIYPQLKSSRPIQSPLQVQYDDGDDQTKPIREILETTQHPLTRFSGFSFLKIIQSLVQIILPSELVELIHQDRSLRSSDHPDHLKEIHRSRRLILLHPRFSLHHALFQVLLIPLIAALIRLKLEPTVKTWADRHLTLLLDLADPKLVFSSLLSLASTNLAASQLTTTLQNYQSDKISKTFSSEISQVLSIRLLRPSGLRALLQSVVTDDYHDDDDPPQDHHHPHLKPKTDQTPITSATLKRFESLYYLLSHPSSTLSAPVYWDTILGYLIEIILPDFLHHTPNHPQTSENRKQKTTRAPDNLRRTACYVLNRLIVRQPQVYKLHLVPIIHSAFRPRQSILDSNLELGLIVVPSSRIMLTIQLINELILNSDPFHIFIDRLILPILPQLVSMSIFLVRTKGDPVLREMSLELITIWIKVNEVRTVAEWLRRSIRELEIGRELNLDFDESRSSSNYQDRQDVERYENQWARDDDGRCCIKFDYRDSDRSLDFNLDPSDLIHWFEVLKNRDFITPLFANWLNELQYLQSRSGFQEAKMTLFRIQACLKLIESFDCSSIIKKHPEPILNFIHQSLDIDYRKKSSKFPRSSSPSSTIHPDLDRHGLVKEKCDQPINALDSLKFLNFSDHHDSQTPNPEKEGDEDLDDGILLAALTLFVALLDANLDLEERNTPILKEISKRLDRLLLDDTSRINAEVYELGMKSRLMISVRKALSEVDGSMNNKKIMDELEAQIEKDKKELERRYKEGLILIRDDCIPLRSQGIGILKEILSLKITNTKSKPAFFKESSKDAIYKLVDSWAEPVIEILLRLIEEEDSFVYLNAIKALSSLAETYHHVVCFNLNLSFGTLPTSFSQKDLDRRLRIGEAMVQIIQRAGSALPIYIDRLIPSLLVVLHSNSNKGSIPDSLKTSSLTILRACIDSSLVTMLPYLSDLIESCMTILKTIMVDAPIPNSKQEDQQDQDDEYQEDQNQDRDQDQVLLDNLDQLKMLRRAAIFLIEGILNQIYELIDGLNSSIANSASNFRKKMNSNTLMLLKTIQVNFYSNLMDLHRLLNYLLIPSHPSSSLLNLNDPNLFQSFQFSSLLLDSIIPSFKVI